MPDEMSQGILQAYLPSFCEGVDLVIAPSKGMENVLRQLNVQNSIEVVPNGVDLNSFHQAIPIERSRFGYGPEDILLVYAGRIALEKNLPFLLKSFRGVAQAIPNASLIIIGSGVQGYDDEIKSISSELALGTRVNFIGKVAYEDLPGYLAMCDIFVTASVTEVHPLSVIEAMATGLPVLGIHSVGVGDIVQDGNSGVLSTHDLASFTAKLTRLCLDTPLRKQMSKSAQSASSEYAIERTTLIMLDYYEKLVHKSRPYKGSWSVRLRSMLERIIT